MDPSLLAQPLIGLLEAHIRVLERLEARKEREHLAIDLAFELIALPYLDPKYFVMGQEFITAIFQVALAARVFQNN